jgi:hypothetical protein
MRERERENNHIASLAFLAACILFLPISAFADNLILGVPDWNQPGNQPDNISGYPNWCAPTSGAMLMGYWEDVLGTSGLADRQVYPSIPAYPSNAGTWQQGLWHDGTIEMGWWMDTGAWRTNGGPFPPNVGGTFLSNIKTGLELYAKSAWSDPGGINKIAFPSVNVSTDTSLSQTMWDRYKAEIDAGRPVVTTFGSWVSDPAHPVGTTTVRGQAVSIYGFSATGGAHTVLGVGYIDSTPNQFIGDEAIIAKDNWPTTPQYVAVPLNDQWWLNDYVSFGPYGAPLPYRETFESYPATADLNGRGPWTSGSTNAGHYGGSGWFLNADDWPGFPGRVAWFEDGDTYTPIDTNWAILHLAMGSSKSLVLSMDYLFQSHAFLDVALSGYALAPGDPGWLDITAILGMQQSDAIPGRQYAEGDLSDVLAMAGVTTDAYVRFRMGADGSGSNWIAYIDNVTATPEPATLSLLALGGLALLRRRGRKATRPV